MCGHRVDHAARGSPGIGPIARGLVAVMVFLAAAGVRAGDGPDPIFELPAPVTMAELDHRAPAGVAALEVSDYASGHYRGTLTPSPPHGDLNPGKAVVICWKDHPQRFVFSHEASDCPIMELPAGAGWGEGRWDHWPIGWLNSQGSDWKPGSPFPYSFGSIGQFFVPAGKWIHSFWRDYSENCRDMELNRWTARRVYYVLLGAARRWEDVRRLGRSWLDQGERCADPGSIADLKCDY